MTSGIERRLRILGRLVEGGAADASALCAVCVEVASVSGAAMLLVTSDGTRALPAATDGRSRRVMELQDTLGEGPSLDAHRLGQPIVEADLPSAPGARWPAFAPLAVEAGVLAIAALPLHIGAIKLGAIELHMDETGELDDEQHANAHALAEVAASAIISLQATAAPGQVAAELLGAIDFQYVVHQACGMVAAQLEIPVAAALAVLQARAFSLGRTIRDVSADVVARRMRLDDES